MNTNELKEYMLRDDFISQQYGGVVALNEIPTKIDKPSIYIVNSDPNYLPGTHWYAVYFNQVSEHFDSAGFDPCEPLTNQLIANSFKFRYNTNRVQNYYTETCGLFCLFYSYFRCRSFTFVEIMDMFSNNLELNENIVKSFYEKTLQCN